MVADIKIEIWAYKFFKTWLDGINIVLADVIEIYKDECLKDDSCLEECDEQMILKAIDYRSHLLRSIFWSKVSILEIERIKSLSEANEYITSICDQDDLSGHLTVFQRMLVTVGYAFGICMAIHKHCVKRIDVIRYGHIIWAMYFDKFTDEFYEKGGWSELKRETKSCSFVFDFLSLFPETSSLHFFQSVKEAAVNYYRFKNSFNFEERKPDDSVHLSKLWIKFQVEHFQNYINIPISHGTSVNAYEVELLIEELKLLLNISRFNSNDIEISTEKHQSSTLPTDILDSEVNSASEVENDNTDEDTHIQRFILDQEIRMDNKDSDDLSQISTIDLRNLQRKCSTSSLENFNLDIDLNRNKGLDQNTFRKTELLRQTSSVDATTYANSEYQFVSNATINSGNELEMSLCSKKDAIATAEIKDVSATDPIVESDMDRFSGEPSLQDFSSGNKNNFCVDEMKRIRAKNELKMERENPEVKSFLRMLLVLGDMEATKFVISTFVNTEKNPENKQESSTNQNKMPKANSTLQNRKEYSEKSQEISKKKKKKKDLKRKSNK